MIQHVSITSSDFGAQNIDHNYQKSLEKRFTGNGLKIDVENTITIRNSLWFAYAASKRMFLY